MMVNTVVLVVSAALPVTFGELGLVYFVISSAFGLRFVWLNWNLVLDPSKVLARKIFFFSMSYLAVVFVAIVVDRNIPLQF